MLLHTAALRHRTDPGRALALTHCGCFCAAGGALGQGEPGLQLLLHPGARPPGRLAVAGRHRRRCVGHSSAMRLRNWAGRGPEQRGGLTGGPDWTPPQPNRIPGFTPASLDAPLHPEEVPAGAARPSVGAQTPTKCRPAVSQVRRRQTGPVTRRVPLLTRQTGSGTAGVSHARAEGQTSASGRPAAQADTEAAQLRLAVRSRGAEC